MCHKQYFKRIKIFLKKLHDKEITKYLLDLIKSYFKKTCVLNNTLKALKYS